MTTHPFANIYGEHQDIKHAIHLAKQFTKNDQPVLITGEVEQANHALHKKWPFICCAGFDEIYLLPHCR